MKTQILGTLGIAALATFAVGCAETGNTNTAANANMANANNMNVTATATPMTGMADANMTNTNMNASMPNGIGTSAPDNSTVTTVTEGDARVETRTFNNPTSPVRRVVVRTDKAGKRTARVTYSDNTERDLPAGTVERALNDTGDALSTAGGYVADKTKQGLKATGEAAGDVRDATGRTLDRAADRTVEGAKTVGEGAKNVGSRAVEVGKEGGNAVVEGAKDVGKGAAKGAKKVGGAIKDAVN